MQTAVLKLGIMQVHGACTPVPEELMEAVVSYASPGQSNVNYYES